MPDPDPELSMWQCPNYDTWNDAEIDRCEECGMPRGFSED